MSREFEERFDEWFRWWREHHNDTDALEQQVKFLRKAVEGLMELTAYAMRDVRALEGRPRETLGQPLWLPGPISMRGNVRRRG